MELGWEFWVATGASGLSGIAACALFEAVCRGIARRDYGLRDTADLPPAVEKQARDTAIRPTAVIAVVWSGAAFVRYGATWTTAAAIGAFVFCAMIRSGMEDDEPQEYL